ncbi:hypothetical protein [Thalassobaculum sp.]|uniref:hypothetical protein n=1 Tax=Thalassobaculum sp. TaxID=2022740 RepID=UPI0032F01A6E
MRQDGTGTAPRRPVRRLLLAAAVATGLTGCAGAHFYSPENDKTAAAAKAASDGLNLVATIDQERGNLEKLLQSDIAMTAAFSRTLRDGELQALIEDSAGDPLSRRLQDSIARRMRTLTRGQAGATDDAPSPKAILDNADAQSSALSGLVSKRSNYTNTLLIPSPACPADGPAVAADAAAVDAVLTQARQAWDDHPDVTRDLVAGVHGTYAEACAKYQDAAKALTGLVEGLIGQRAAAWRTRQEELGDAVAKAEAAKLDYKTALDDYLKASKAAGANPSEAAKKQLADGIGKVRKALGKLADANAFGKAEATGEQIARIDLILKAAATGPLDAETLGKADDETRKAAAVAAMLPSLAGRLSTIAALEAAPPVNALIFEKNRLLALKLGADRAVDRAKARVGLRQRQFEATVAELEILLDADLQRARATAGGAITTSDLLRPDARPEKARRQMIAAVATYLNSFTGPRRIARELDYRLIDVTHAGALDASETSLRLWQDAVQQPVTVLAAYHESGVRQEDLIEILKAVGLFAIAGSVN